MRAVVCTRYGPPEVLRLQDLPTPTPPEERGAHPHSGDFCDVERLLPPRAEADSRLPDHGAADIGVVCAQTTGTGRGAVKGSGCGRIGRPASGAVGTSAVQLARHIGAQDRRLQDQRTRSHSLMFRRFRGPHVCLVGGRSQQLGERVAGVLASRVRAPPIETTRRRPVTSPPCRRRVAGCVTR